MFGRKERRTPRITKYGIPITKEVAAMTKKKNAPLHEELTSEGALKYRKPAHRDEFSGTQGSPMEAVILDIDGTLQTWGQGADPKVLEYCKKHYDQNRVLIVVTARTHDYDYERSFNWLMKNLPYPFIGPFHRACDDPRYASEFKRGVAQGFEDMGLYRIVGAADDNQFVNAMWKAWGVEHFENPEDFDLLECSYGNYGTWRNELPTKGTPRTWTSTTDPLPWEGKTWVPGNWDGANWTPGHYTETTPRGDDEFDDLNLLSDNDRWALEDEVLTAHSDLTLTVIEKMSDTELQQLLTGDTERGDRITNRLDLEESVYANYPDMGWAEIQQMDVEDLRLMAENPDQLDAPVGGAA